MGGDTIEYNYNGNNMSCTGSSGNNNVACNLSTRRIVSSNQAAPGITLLTNAILTTIGLEKHLVTPAVIPTANPDRRAVAGSHGQFSDRGAPPC